MDMVATEVDTVVRDLLIPKLWLNQRQLLQVIHTTEDMGMEYGGYNSVNINYICNYNYKHHLPQASLLQPYPPPS